MGREQDIVFCKIAMTAGLVSQEQAQKCLTLADRREAEGNRRPMIGAIFSKHNLLTPEEVQRVNQAVAKRLGTAVPGTRPVATKKRGKAKRKSHGDGRRALEHHGSPSAARRGRGPKNIDKNTLWMGLGTGVVFVAVILTILILYAKSSSTTPTAGKKAPRGSTGSVASVESNGDTTGAGATSAGGVASVTGTSASAQGASTPAPAAVERVSEEFQRSHSTALQQANTDAYIDQNPGRAISYLERFLEEHKADYDLPGGQALREEALARIQEFRGGESAGSADDASGDDIGL